MCTHDMVSTSFSLPMTHRDAEVANVAFETSHMRVTGPRFALVPVGLVHGHPERPGVTPKIHFESRSGGYLGKHMQAPGISAGARRSGSSGSRSRGSRGNGGTVSSAVSAVHAGQKRMLAAEARVGVGGSGHRVKRQTLAPSRITVGADNTLKLELQECKKLLKDLLAHKSAWPFSRSVDITKYPDYYDTISNPMDLGTMKKKLDNCVYGELESFAADLRLVWANCYTYNKDPNSDVCVMARELEGLGEARLARIPEVIEEKRGESKAKQTDDFKSMQKQLRLQQKQVLEMQQLMLQQQVGG